MSAFSIETINIKDQGTMMWENNMEFYNNNLEKLKKKNINLYNNILKSEQILSEESEQKFYVTQARNGSEVIGLHRGDRKYLLNSQYSPEHEAEMWAKGFSWNGYENVFIMFGLVNGTYIRALLKEERVNRILIYEPSKELFYYVLHHFDMGDILESEKVLLIVEGFGEETFQHYLEAVLTIKNMRSVQRGIWPYYQELFYESYKKYLKIIGIADKEKTVGFNTTQHFCNTWIENHCINLKYLKESTILEECIPIFDKNQPVIIVSAGPSVKDELEGLKAAKNHIPILAVDRIVDFLMDNGVEPDAIFTIDAKYRRTLMNVQRVSHIPLVIGATSSCEITESHKGKKIWFADSKFLNSIFSELGKKIKRYETGTTVSSMAFTAFLGNGYKKIILVGQDLSYDGEFSHAGGVKEQLPYMRKEYTIEGIQGTTVRARDDWYTMLRWYNGILARHPEVTVYDAKSHGAKIMHTINIRLKEFIEQRQWENIDYRKKIVEIAPTFSNEEWTHVLAELNNGLRDLKLGKEKATTAIMCCERLVKGVEEHLGLTKEDEADLKELKEANEFLESHRVFTLLAAYIDNYVREAMYALNEKEGDIQLDAKKAYMAAIIQMQAVQYGVDYLYPKLEQAVKQIEEES